MEPRKLYMITEYIDESDLDYNKTREAFCGIISATEEELKTFLEKWNKSRIYGYSWNGELKEHEIVAEEVKVLPAESFEPYKKEFIDQPDLPHCGQFRIDSEYYRYKFLKEENCWINLDNSKKYNLEGEPLC